MPCNRATLKEVISAGPKQTVKEVLELFSKHGIASVPVVEGGNILGIFCLNDVLKKLLPTNVTLDHGEGMEFRLDYTVGASPQIAHHLQDILDVEVEELMTAVEDLETVSDETSLWEAVRLLVRRGSPLVVVDKPHSTVLSGLITPQSMVNTLLEIDQEENKA